jgi:two-component system, LuxR family, sensor kinase FixL
MESLTQHLTRNILENILHGVIVTDTRAHIEFWNPACEDIFGYTAAEVIRRPINILFDDRSELTLKELLLKCSRSEPVYGRWHGVRKDGSGVWIEVRARLIKNENGEPRSCIITLTDIEKYKTTEEQLKQNRAVAEAILSTSADAIITADEKGIIQGVNKSACEMFGYREKELAGTNLSILMPFPYNINHNGYMQKYLLTGEKHVIGKGREMKGLRKDGSVFPIELAVSEICFEGSRIYAGIIRDLTSRRNLERKLIEISNDERRRIGRDLHDGLGQMLTGIRMLSESLARKLNANALPGADEVQEIAGMIREADEMARSISRDMVQVELEKRGLQVAIEDLCRKTSKMTGVNCELVSAGLVEIEDHTMALHLYRIVQEAINNAVKHGSSENISVRLSRTIHHISVTVDDDGIGFSETSKSTLGAGMEIMKYRAGIMGGILEITRTEEEKTQVRCIIPNNLEHF